MDYAFAKIAFESAIFTSSSVSKIPCFVTLTVESDMCLMLGDLSSVGCGQTLRVPQSRSEKPPRLLLKSVKTTYPLFTMTRPEREVETVSSKALYAFIDSKCKVPSRWSNRAAEHNIQKRRVNVCGHRGQVHRRYLRGPGGENRLLVVPFCEYSMRGSPSRWKLADGR